MEHTIVDAFNRTRLLNDAAGELRASFAASHKAFVTVLRQSTQVPKTSKRRAFGCGSGSAILEEFLLCFAEVSKSQAVDSRLCIFLHSRRRCSTVLIQGRT